MFICPCLSCRDDGATLPSMSSIRTGMVRCYAGDGDQLDRVSAHEIFRINGYLKYELGW